MRKKSAHTPAGSWRGIPLHINPQLITLRGLKINTRHLPLTEGSGGAHTLTSIDSWRRGWGREMSYRSFPSEIESIANTWHESVYTDETWIDKRQFSNTESMPREVVSSSGIRGIAKPGVRKNDGIARAAHEKIASDLAYRLSLPVPPVILWDRGESCPWERYTCISAFAFENITAFDKVPSNILQQCKDDISKKFSAMLPFEIWIGADDRKLDHVLVGDITENTLQLAFIDYAYSLSYFFRRQQDDRILRIHVPYQINRSTILEVIEKITLLNGNDIAIIVNRIPEQYLNNDKKSLILDNLNFRREILSELVRRGGWLNE